MFGFLLDTESLMDLERPSVIPPIQYSFVHHGGGFSYGIVPIYFITGLRLAYRAGLDVGDDAPEVLPAGVGPGVGELPHR